MLTYAFHIFDVDISSIINKSFYCKLFAFCNCNVQGSMLMKTMKEKQI